MRMMFVVRLLVTFGIAHGIYSNANKLFKEQIVKTMCELKLGKPGKLGIHHPHLPLCVDDPIIFFNALQGFNKGISHCRENFKCRRWNCSTYSSNHEYRLFGVGMPRASKEAAVMLAMASAGMVEHVTSEIQHGKSSKNRNNNPCQMNRVVHSPKEYVNVNDCDADVTKGDTFAQKIVEMWKPHLNEITKEKKMNYHNAAVGRLAVRENMDQVCRCYGLSGACNGKCCYKTMKPLGASIKWLMKKYDNAKKVVWHNSRRKTREPHRTLMTVDDSKSPDKRDLIYLIDSPDYCEKDKNTSSLGTSGRFCNKCNSTSNSCEKMCCGRGYNTYRRIKESRCNCKFKYCCKVQCDICKEDIMIHTCK